MNEENTLQLMALATVKGLSCANVRKLLSLYDKPDTIFRQTPAELADTTGLGINICEYIASKLEPCLKTASEELSLAKNNGIEIVTCLDDNYPSLLSECNDAPLFLFYKGQKNVFNGKKYLSVVGTRNASDYGKSICRKLISEIAEKVPDLCIVSGLAYGIDVCSHIAALENELPTIAVMAGGLRKIYPSSHKHIAEKICGTGAVISEFPFYEEYFRPNFIRRNRIIAGMSEALIVIESAKKGGSLVTANMAISYNRDVYAIPGRVGDVWSEGCNNLISRQKAGSISSAEDFLYFMPWNENTDKQNHTETNNSLIADLSENEKQLYDFIKKENNVHKDSIALSCNITEDINFLLLDLEMRGIIKSLPGNFYTTV